MSYIRTALSKVSTKVADEPVSWAQYMLYRKVG